MNKFEHILAPSLGELYARQFVGSSDPVGSDVIDARQLFYQLHQSGNNADVMPGAYGFILQGLKKVTPAYLPLDRKAGPEAALAALIAPEVAAFPEQLQTQENCYQAIDQFAAIQLAQPCWLQNFSQISCIQAETVVQLISLYLQFSGAGQGGDNRQKLYSALILSSGRKMPILYSEEYSQQAELMPEVFDFAVIQLALARFPRVFLAEILGFSLAFCQMPTLPAICFPKQPALAAFIQLHQQQVTKQLPQLNNCILDYLDLFPEQQQLWRRIQNGFWFYHGQMQMCRDRLLDVLAKPLTEQQAVAQLLHQKASAAMGHHQKIQLQGKTLDAWFTGLPANSDEFLLALKQSGYVNQQKPDDSLLLKLFDFKGPMFGVLDQPELEMIKNWLHSGLNEGSTNTIEKQKKTSASDIKLPLLRKQAQIQYTKLSDREMYYYLLNADLFPDVLPAALAKARNRLQARALFNPLPFKHYSHQQFDTYIDTIYQQEISAYQPLQGKPKISREAYIWGLEQIAPMILIDGCWLQNSLALQNINPEISDILFNIYCDEIGNGRLEKNHPYIFQQLLDSLSIRVPPVHSQAFVKHSGFIDSAFDLPVYMLALSSSSVKFFPELLGLNMAIELSGLGKGYMRLVDDWNYWGIDPSIANIHISIDNAASGHTFLAKKAIKLYMDEILHRSADHALLDKHWRRIYSGYASLRFVGGRFKIGLPIWYLIYKFRAKDSQSQLS